MQIDTESLRLSPPRAYSKVVLMAASASRSSWSTTRRALGHSSMSTHIRRSL
jgi:hypothetical protein